MGSSKNRRTNERRHRRMEEARQKVLDIMEEMNQTHTNEELVELRQELSYWYSRSTRRANQLS